MDANIGDPIDAADLIAIDWGTSNRRIYAFGRGRLLEVIRDDRGVSQRPDFEAELAKMRAQYGAVPTVMSGMVGSSIGWREVPYVSVPCALSDVAAGALRVDPMTVILPGAVLATEQRADVMRGEEVQILGAVAAGLVPADAMVVQPGTHSKWARVEAGRISDFVTSMTGELFGLLRSHAVLAAQLQGEVVRGAAFLEGVEEGAKGDLGASLFGIRSAKLVGRRADVDAASFASGLLIGAEVRSRLAEAGTMPIYIVSGPSLGQLYQDAIEALGGKAMLVDGDACFVAAMLEIGKALACMR